MWPFATWLPINGNVIYCEQTGDDKARKTIEVIQLEGYKDPMGYE
jgi:hypothetical protein